MTNAVEKIRFGVALAGLLLIGVFAAPAQSMPSSTPPAKPAASPSGGPAAPQVRVTSRANGLQVEVPEQVPLSTVLSDVCREQKIKCSGTETLAGYKGPAMTVDGSLRQVVSKLLEGTDVNYEFSRSANGGPTAISFLGHAPHGTAAVPSPVAAPEPARPAPLHSVPYPGKVDSPPPSNRETTAPPSGPGVSSSAPASDAQSEAERNLRIAAEMFTGTGKTEAAQFLPFPDGQGQPIPIVDPQQKPAVLPFPDQFGNPIPAKPAPKGASPFPVSIATPTDKQ